jgi:hypothetical protein
MQMNMKMQTHPIDDVEQRFFMPVLILSPVCPDCIRDGGTRVSEMR